LKGQPKYIAWRNKQMRVLREIGEHANTMGVPPLNMLAKYGLEGWELKQRQLAAESRRKPGGKK